MQNQDAGKEVWKDLQFLYDKELEWKPYENEKLYSQEEYDKLVGNIPEMDIDAAKKFVVDSFGFSPDRILIMSEYQNRKQAVSVR